MLVLLRARASTSYGQYHFVRCKLAQNLKEERCKGIGCLSDFRRAQNRGKVSKDSHFLEALQD